LGLARNTIYQQDDDRPVQFEVEDVFSHRKPVFVTITAGTQGTSVYVDGALVKLSPNFGLSSRDLTGQLVVANSPADNDSWSGRLLGLAIYGRELNAAEVSRHYETWTKTGHPEIAESEEPVGLYLFNERGANVVRNQINSATNLLIPEHYFVLYEPFLVPPWREFRLSRDYWKNVIINIAGFVPLGFFFCGYFSFVRPISRGMVAATAWGFAISLIIEILQAFLPTRSSGMTDIITNTLGTAVGAMLYGWRTTRILLDKVGISTPSAAENTESVSSLSS
jgi:VanZ family protein